MGISDPKDPLHIVDFAFLPQECTSVSTDFDEDAQNAWMEEMMIEKKLNPDQFTRVWAHTHPSQSASPSSTDWETFQEIMGNMPWGVMLILGTSNEFSCVFRVKEQMLNIPVLTAPQEINPEWAKELENIKPPKPRPIERRQGYYQEPSHWLNQTGGYGKAKKKDTKLEIAGWELSKAPIWSVFHKNTKELTNSTPYPQLQTWSPTFEEIMSFGPCKALTMLKEAYSNSTSSSDFSKIEAIAETLSRLLSNDNKFIAEYSPETAWSTDVMGFMLELRSSPAPYEEYLEEEWHEFYKWLEFSKNKLGVETWFLSQKNNYLKEIASLFTVSTEEAGCEALSACLTAIAHFPEVCDEIDKHCKAFIESFTTEQQEYQQSLLDHETSVI